jgi:dephospho-CoA kinase
MPVTVIGITGNKQHGKSTIANYLIEKYTNPDGIHHYEIAQSSGPITSSDNSHLIEVYSTTPGASSVSNREYEERIQNVKRQIRLLNTAYLNIFIEEFQGLIGE